MGQVTDIYQKTHDFMECVRQKVATDKEDMSRLTWQVAQDNRISDPGHLQPGTELIIRVQKAREL